MAPMSYRLALLLGVLGGVASVAAAPAPQEPTPPADAANACGLIASATVAFKSETPAIATPTVPAQVALDCLQSVPNKPEPAVKLIDSLRAFVQWQSTHAWLMAPPESYMLPPTDIMGSLDNFSSMASSGMWRSEYEFQGAIVELWASAHDGHLSYRPDLFKAFGFRNNLTIDLVSVSTDGIEVPKLYHMAELMSNATAGGAMPRSVTMINGRPYAAVIEELDLKFSGYQDPDSEWNSQFGNYARPSALSFLSGTLVLQGPSITLTYDNGDERSQDNHAIIRDGADFAGVTNGEDFYNRFCNPEAAAATTAATPTSASPTPTPTTLAVPAPTIEGFPFPVIRDQAGNITSGYFLNGTGYEDVAVLSVLGFSPAGTATSTQFLTDFQATIAAFLAQCKTAGKTKLVIDVTANGGGYVVAGYELFSQLFPDADLFQAHDLRLTDGLADMARLTNALIPEELNAAANGTETQQQALSVIFNSEVLSNLLPGSVFTPTGENFTTVDDILSPVTLQGDRFTAYQSTPLNQTSQSYNLTGTGTKANPPPSVFAAEDIVLLTDGTCGSTCTLFAYLMIMQRDVKTVVVGGRPQTGPMQSIAGVEGAQVFPLTSLAGAAAAVISLSDEVKQGEVNGSDLAIMAEGYAISRAANPASAGSVNGKNAFSPSDARTPLQFLYMPANCRFFYTREMINGPAEVWKRAVDATWTDPERFCVAGSRMEVVKPDQTDPFFRASVDSGAAGSRGGVVGLAVAVAAVVGLFVF